MGIISEVVAGPLIDSIKGIIQQFHISPEEKLQAQQAVDDAAAKAQQAAADYDVQLNTIAGQNIRAEETNGDRYTSRARPTVIYIGCFAILINYCVMGFFKGRQPVSIPDAFWWTWGTIVTGYVFSRSGEKIASMSGDSQVNVLGGLVKVSNKSGGPTC